jgi:membrane protein YqaA with SNARE-associated domain
MLLLVAGWAFAEAILFFLVADIPISFIAVRYGWRAGMKAALVAAVAAMLGGLVTYGWAAADPSGVTAMIQQLPAIDARLMATTRESFSDNSYVAMFWGSLSGIPYKLYALAAGVEGRALLPFVLLSPVLRLPRFLLAAALAASIGKLLSRRLTMRSRVILLAAIWLLFYVWYFMTMPG